MGDAPISPELLEQIPPDQEIAGVTADEASDTRSAMTPLPPEALPRSYRPAET